MVNTSIEIPDDLLEDFERTLARKKADGEIPTNVTRSEMIRQLMREWVEESGAVEGNRIPAAVAD